MNNRLKEVRSSLKMNTRDFASRLGMSAGAISLLENGKREITPRFITSICNEFNVDREWFETGIGQMTKPPTKNEEIAGIVKKLFEGDEETETIALAKELLELFLQMDDAQQELMLGFARQMINK